MTSQEILERLNDERKVGSRFPVRVIFVEDKALYMKFINDLRRACDVTLEVADFCSGPDVFPNFSKLSKKIGELRDKHILLLSVGEYLRLSILREIKPDRANLPSLWQKQQNASSKTRVIIPLLFCRDLWERAIVRNDERQMDHIWTLSVSPEGKQVARVSTPEAFSLKIYSKVFDEALADQRPILGIKEWLLTWQNIIAGSKKECSLITSLFHNSEQTYSPISTEIISDSFKYIIKKLKNSHRLRREWAENEDYWLYLFKNLGNFTALEDVTKKILNINDFEPIKLLAQYSVMPDEDKWVMWLWYKLEPDNSYCSYAIKEAINHKKIPESIVHSIFKSEEGLKNKEWIKERHAAIDAMKMELSKIDIEKIIKEIEKLDSLDLKISLICTKNHKEKAFLIRTISRSLNSKTDLSDIIPLLEDRYPLLYHYMRDLDESFPSEVKDYFRWYKESKLRNLLPPEAAEKVQEVNLEHFESRYSELKKLENEDAFFLWVDGMGAEWLPLLLYCIRKKTDNLLEAKLARAITPTETVFNKHWENTGLSYKKLDELDKLAHNGSPDDKDYFSCISHQLELIDNISDEAITYLGKYNYVIITADHGTSRLAALAFHQLKGFTAPPKSTVRSHGRYCELLQEPSPRDILPESAHVKLAGRNFIAFKNHEHYIQSGNAAGLNDENQASAGEIHGGMTPEETLVPVVVIKNKTFVEPDFELLTPVVFQENRHVSLKIRFSKKITKLTAQSDKIDAECLQTEKQIEWDLIFKDIKPGSHLLTLQVSGKDLKKTCSFEVKKRGIAENDVLGD